MVRQKSLNGTFPYHKRTTKLVRFAHLSQIALRKCSTDITKMREDVKRNYSHLDRAISKVVSRKIIFESEDPGLDEIIN